MPNGSEFQTMGAATLKPWDAKIVQTHKTDNRLVLAEHRERVGYGNSKGSVGKQEEWSRELWVSVASLNFMHCSIGSQRRYLSIPDLCVSCGRA